LFVTSNQILGDNLSLQMGQYHTFASAPDLSLKICTPIYLQTHNKPIISFIHSPHTSPEAGPYFGKAHGLNYKTPLGA
jgi:hypothetical protein